ncbi:MAG: bifunctional riboflavin kinase/FAD synthetase [Firmicutes bacterium]|nr:bifunctional riboflavin kinase/FAD synthetase [Bacillota bacterium]
MSERRTGAVAIGNFDGVHLGHRAVLERTRARAAEAGGRSAVLTFDPHPSAVLHPDRPAELLTTREERIARIHATGVDDVHVLTFDRALARLEPEAFVTGILWPRLRPRWVVVGTNFTFGRGARGRAADLARMGERLGFGVEVVEPVVVDGGPVSSSRIRERVRIADMPGARRLMGAPYTMGGTVVARTGRGRTLGVPTANLVPPEGKCLPPEGVYAVWVRLPDGRRAMGAADLGRRPTFEQEGELLLEVHVLDGAHDLYGKALEVEFVRYVRPDRAFPGEGELAAAMREDVATVRAVLSADASGSP